MNKFKENFLVSVPVAILMTFFIQPIFNFIWNIFLNSLSAIDKNAVDKIYIYSASGSVDRMGFVNFLVLIYLLILIITLNIDKLFGNPNDFLAKYIRHMKQFFFFLALVLYFFCLYYVGIIVESSNRYAAFEQDLKIIAPKITDLEYKNWDARWALMKNSSDYSSLVSDFKSRAVSLNIVLPKNLSNK